MANDFPALSLGILGFLGGVTITTLILVIQIIEKYPYAEFLLTAIATISFLFIIASWGTIHEASNPKTKKEFSDVLAALKMASFFGLIAIIPFLIYPFTTIGSILLGVIEIIIVLIVLKYFEPKL